MKLGFISNAAEAERQLKATLDKTHNSILAGVQDATNTAKQGLREMTRGALHGNRLPNSWQSKLYGKTSFNPAGMVYTKAPEIMRAFSEGATIHNSHGRFLAIPTELVPRIGNRRMRPEDFDGGPQPLRFVPPKGARHDGLLVLDNVRINSKGRVKLASDTAVRKGKTATAVMFILIPEVTLRKRLDPDAIVKAAADEIPASINKHLQDGGK